METADGTPRGSEEGPGQGEREREREMEIGGEGIVDDEIGAQAGEQKVAGQRVHAGAAGAGPLAQERDDGEFEYHSSEVDLLGDPDDERWSIRCIDVHKRLGGAPVLNGLNVGIPDGTITLVLGPCGTTHT